MSSFTAEDRAAMADSVRRLLADLCTEAGIRRAMESEAGYDPALWTALVDLGVPGLVIDPAHDGLGGGPVELEAIMEEAGAALLPAPLFAVTMAAALIAACGDAAASDRLLPGLARGRIATVALTGESGTWTPDGVALAAHAHGERWFLDGTASFVLHGAAADLVLAVARIEGGFGVFEVAAKAPGLAIERLQSFDRTLRLTKMDFRHVPAARLGQAGWEAVEAMLRLALVALAGEQAGGARRVLEMTVHYAKTRIQFGRAIGSFQAIKHMAADLLLESESATSAARAAAEALASGAPDAAEAVHLAAFACADAYAKTAADAIQMHGGIAFTWAHPAHLYLRRARADQHLLGGPAYHRERFLQAMGA